MMRDAIDTVRQFSRRVYHNRCFYCGVQLAFGRMLHNKMSQGTPNSSLSNEYWWNAATYDHWVPQSKGGGHRHKVPCCFHCNGQKAALGVEDFRLVFFGGHGGLFWGERLAERVRTLPSRPMPELPPPMSFAEGCGSIDRWEAKRRHSCQTKTA